jgi:hypothetical protein
MADDRMAVLETVRKAIADGDVDFLREGVRVLAEAVMEAEVTELTGVPHGERDPERRLTHRNGYRERRWDTRVGTIPLAVPRIRDGSYLPSLLEPRRRAERALLAVVQEAYVSGVSTRRVDDLVRALGIAGISRSEVSRICAALDAEVAAFRGRSLADTAYPYLWLDAKGGRVHGRQMRAGEVGPELVVQIGEGPAVFDPEVLQHLDHRVVADTAEARSPLLADSPHVDVRSRVEEMVEDELPGPGANEPGDRIALVETPRGHQGQSSRDDTAVRRLPEVVKKRAAGSTDEPRLDQVGRPDVPLVVDVELCSGNGRARSAGCARRRSATGSRSRHRRTPGSRVARARRSRRPAARRRGGTPGSRRCGTGSPCRGPPPAQSLPRTIAGP